MTVKQQYQKQRARVRSLINRYRKLGFDVNINLPKIPKQITPASVNRLSKITPEKVRRKSYAPSPATGEAINYYQFKSQSKKAGTPKLTPAQLYENVSRETLLKKPTKSKRLYDKMKEVARREEERQQTTQPDEDTPFWEDLVISNFRDVIDHMQYQTLMDTVSQWLDTMINLHGDTKTAEMLQETAERGFYARLESCYREQELQGILTEMVQFMDISAGEKNAILSDFYSSTDIYDEFYDYD